MATPESVATLAAEVESMKAILSTKIGANDDIMVAVTDKLGSLTTKLDEFYAQLVQNDTTIKQVITDNAAEVADLKGRIGTKVGESDSVLVGLQAALGFQNAEISALKLQIGNMTTEQRTTTGRSEGSNRFGIIDCKGISNLKILENGNSFNHWTKRFLNALEQYRPFAREAIGYLVTLNIDIVASTLSRLIETSDSSTRITNTDAIAVLYESRYPLGEVTITEWSQLNIDLWSSLVALTSEEPGRKVDNAGQGEGLIAYLRLVS